MAVLMRKKIVSLLGYDSQIVRADLKDVLTLFQAQRFSPIEVTLWKVSGLPAAFSTRTLFVRMLLGYNEPQHSRPHDGRTDSMVLRETFQLNYDPEDETQQLSIVIKQQELVETPSRSWRPWRVPWWVLPVASSPLWAPLRAPGWAW